MPDIAEIIRMGSNAWFYLPVAVVLGALHALEPGHAKSMMAAYIVAIRGTMPQATLLGLSAAIGHTIVVWILAILGLLLGEKYIVDYAEPWLWLLSGTLITILALRLLWSLRTRLQHGHGHSHDHYHDHHHETSTHQNVSNSDIMWFGFSGGLLPCPSAIAVLLVCIHLKAFALGIAMVAAFSVGLAITLVLIGIGASLGTKHAATRWHWFDRLAGKAPYFSAAVMLVMGLIMAVTGIGSINAASIKK